MFSFQTDGFLKDNNNAAQRLLDGMNFMAQSVSELSLGPTKAVTSWLTDQIAPAYWRPNSQILVQCAGVARSAGAILPYPTCSAREAWGFSFSHISSQSIRVRHGGQPVSSCVLISLGVTSAVILLLVDF